jgi:tyrosinase
VNPTNSQWLTGVKFEFHNATGTVVTMTAGQVVDTTAAPLHYKYEDESDPLHGAPIPPHLVTGIIEVESRPMPEMVGASTGGVKLTGKPAHAELAVRAPTGPAALTAATPRKTYLNIENVTGSGKTDRYSVYLNVPEGSDPASHPELRAGELPMFGVVEASRADEGHSGSGLHYSLDVTELVRRLASQAGWDPSKLRVSFVPKRVLGQHEIQVGRISLYHE